MKVRLSFKTPDVVEYAIKDVTQDEDLAEEITCELEKWIKYSECVTLEYDTETKDIKVCEV